MWGLYERDPYGGLSLKFLDHLYRTLQLFTLGAGWTTNTSLFGTPGAVMTTDTPLFGSPLPLQIQFARFLAPLFSVVTFLSFFIRGFFNKILSLLARISIDHIVIVGLGDKGWQLVNSCLESGKKVVVIEKDVTNQFIKRCERRLVTVIIGDACDPRVLKNCNLEYASDFVVVSGDDGANLEIGVNARKYSGATSLRIHLHVIDSALSNQLEDWPKFVHSYTNAEINFFNLYELSARQALKKYPPDIYADVYANKANTGYAHLAIFGWGGMAEHLVLEAARICHFKKGSKLKVNIYSQNPSEDQWDFVNKYTQHANLANISFAHIDWKEFDIIRHIDKEILQNITQAFVCLDSDRENLKVGLKLRSSFLNNLNFNSPIFVQMENMMGFANLLESNCGKSEIPDSLFPFGMLDHVLNHECIIEEEQDRMAKKMHKKYLEDQRERFPDSNKDSCLEWNRLRQIYRKSNRMATDHINIKLRAIGCSLRKREEDEGFLRVNFESREVTTLSQMEHARWMAEKFSFGWEHGNQRMDDFKVHDNLIPWDGLSKEVKETDSVLVNNIGSCLLEEANETIHRNIIVGIVGHRLNKIDPKNPILIQEVKDAILKLKEKHKHKNIILLSCLAEGSDRLIVKEALEIFDDPQLIVPLPLPYELYKDDFSGSKSGSGKVSSEDEFKEIIGKAHRYFEVPLRFGIAKEMKVIKEGESPIPRQKQYALAGAYIVERCNELIAIWDGNPAEGIGGTGQIINWMEKRERKEEIEEEFSCPSRIFPEPKKNKPIIIPRSKSNTEG